jgi:hypothetical protein
MFIDNIGGCSPAPFGGVRCAEVYKHITPHGVKPKRDGVCREFQIWLIPSAGDH